MLLLDSCCLIKDFSNQSKVMSSGLFDLLSKADIYPERIHFRKSPPSLQPVFQSNSNHSFSFLVSNAKVSLCGLIYKQHHTWLSLAVPLYMIYSTCCLSQIVLARTKSISAIYINANTPQSSAALYAVAGKSMRNPSFHNEKCSGKYLLQSNNTEDALLYFLYWSCRFMQPHLDLLSVAENK